ncbi:MAG: hypothetical protein H7210_13440 [Pyrinomonadaceae bacterium]|nr:hypothetical protein [Phycisphaerales bacterium]
MASLDDIDLSDKSAAGLMAWIDNTYPLDSANRGEIQFIGPVEFGRFRLGLNYSTNPKHELKPRVFWYNDERGSWSCEEFRALLTGNTWYARFRGRDFEQMDESLCRVETGNEYREAEACASA